MGGVLPYKWDACCSTSGRCTVGFPILQGLEARKVQRYKWGAYRRTNWGCTAVLSSRPVGPGRGLGFLELFLIDWDIWTSINKLKTTPTPNKNVSFRNRATKIVLGLLGLLRKSARIARIAKTDFATQFLEKLGCGLRGAIVESEVRTKHRETDSGIFRKYCSFFARIPEGPTIEKNSIPIENFNPGLKFSISIENFNPDRIF